MTDISWDPVWDKIFSSQGWGKYPPEELIRFVARNFYQAPNRADVKILEVGCGPGANLWYLAREGFSFVGIDGSEAAIERARARLDAEIPGWQARGSLHIGDISTLPFPDGAFDAVIDNECIYCSEFTQSQSIYREISRVLRPGGAVYSRTFADHCWGDGTGEHVGHNRWLCSEGPLAGKAPSRFTTLEEIPTLFGDLQIDQAELVTISHNNLATQVREWVIYARKSL